MSKPIPALATAVALLLSAAVQADTAAPPRRANDHPAVVVQRLHAVATYDYASKFYPHPAWLYLLPTPRPELDVRQVPPQPADASLAALARADIE